MASKQEETNKWVGKFCELMDWFLNLEKVTGDDLGEARAKGLAANYLAVKLSIFDESVATNTLNLVDRGLPYESHLWDPPDYSEDSYFEQRKQWRLERMTHWKRKAQEHGVFKSTPLTPEVTPDNVRRYCDCIESIIYRVKDGWDWTVLGDVRALGRQANDLAAKLGLTHPDWLLALDLGMLPYFADNEEARQLPLPSGYEKPPIIPHRKTEVVMASDIPRLRESMEKAQSLLRAEAKRGHEDSEGIPPEYKSPPVSLKRMAGLYGGEMTTKKLRAMIDNGRLRVDELGRQTFIFDVRQLPQYVVDGMRQ